jgi:hypothetical protein
MNAPIGTLLIFFGVAIPFGWVDGMKTETYREPCRQLLYSAGIVPPIEFPRCIVRVDVI